MKTRMILIILTLFFIVTSKSGYSQTQFTGWLASFNTIKTGKKTSIHAEAQFRSSDKIEHLQSAFVRGGLNYSVRKNMIVTAGYGFFHNRRVSGQVVGYANEHRIWQQFIINHSFIKNVQTAHRFRLEQRFIEKTKVVSNELENDGYAYANRFRYFIRNVIPFTKSQPFTKGMFGALQNEVFVNFGNTATVNGKFFDQNRLYLATGYRFSKKFDLEAGYMNQYISGTNKNFTNNHILQLASYLRL